LRLIRLGRSEFQVGSVVEEAHALGNTFALRPNKIIFATEARMKIFWGFGGLSLLTSLQLFGDYYI
jgi:hypothetical protein